MFTTGLLNLDCKESHFTTVTWYLEAELLAGHHVPEDVHNRSVEPYESYFANVPGISEAENVAGHHILEDVHTRSGEP
jgi:hypothetical protein